MQVDIRLNSNTYGMKPIKNNAVKKVKPLNTVKGFKSVYENRGVNLSYLAFNHNKAVKFKGGLSGKNFVNWLEKIAISPEKLVEKVKFANKYIGEGSANIAYEIPENLEYVMRFPRESAKSGMLKIVEDIFPELNIGQTVAEIGNIKVSKKQTGIPAGVPYKDRLGGSMQNVLTYRKHIFRTAEMPQAAYDDLADTFKRLNEHGYSFDMANPNNILVDEKNKKFNLVDDLNEIVDDEDQNSYASLALPLIDTFFAPNLSFSADIAPSWKVIIEKSRKAAQNADLPQPQKNLSCLNYILSLAGMRNTF